MSTRKLLTTLLFAVFAIAAQAQTPAETTAKMKAFVGDVSVKYVDGSSAAATVGMPIPQGAEVITGANAQATVELHEGIVAVLGQNSTANLEQLSVDAAGVRTGLVNLKSGTIASSLDPKKRAINNYAVKTPKGVAAARGTTFSVTFNGATYSCTVVAGVVSSLTISEFVSGGSNANSSAPGHQVTAGNVASSDGNAHKTVTIAQALAEGVATTTGNAKGTTVVTASDAAAGLALLASAVASVSNNVADVTAVVQTIAASAGNSPAATNAVASATAAAAATAATNSNLNGGTTGTATTAAATSVASAIVQAAVTGSVAAGNTTAAATIVATTTAAVAATTNTDRTAATTSASTLATTLSNTANTVPGTQAVDATTVNTAVQQVISNPTTAIGSGTTTTTQVTTTTNTTPSGNTTGNSTTTTTTDTTVTTPQPIDVSTVSRSGP